MPTLLHYSTTPFSYSFHPLHFHKHNRQYPKITLLRQCINSYIDTASDWTGELDSDVKTAESNNKLLYVEEWGVSDDSFNDQASAINSAGIPWVSSWGPTQSFALFFIITFHTPHSTITLIFPSHENTKTPLVSRPFPMRHK